MMGQRQREQVQRGCAVGTVVLLAWLCRVLPLEGLPSGLQEACGILRSLLYLSLFAGWGISLYNRTVHPQVRRLLLNVDLLMLFWILVRTLRFQLNTPPGMDRMLWYLYYAPMLGIPVLCVQLVLTVDRSERYRLSAWARMLWLPSAVLLELVLTNDLHRQVFRLQQPWNENYQYGWLFGLVVGWIVICILLAFGIIAHKSRNPRILRRLPLPAIPLLQRARTPLPRPGGSRKPSGAFLLAAWPAPAEKNRAAPHLCGAVLSGCAGRRTGFRGFRKGAAQRAVFFSSGASGLFSRFSSGISSLLMMVSICSSFFTSSLGKRLFTRWTTVLR